MTEPQTVTIDHVHALRQADSPGAALVLIAGRVEVVEPDQLDSDDYRGALQLLTREELSGCLGDEPTADDLAQQAAALTVAAQHLGG